MMRQLTALTAVLLLAASSANGQSLSPMRDNILTFGEVGAVRASVRNPYTMARRFDIDVYDDRWNRVENIRLTRKTLSLAPGGKTSILALVPMGEGEHREVFVCATSRPYRPLSAGLKGQVCGRYQLIKRRL